MSAHDVTMLLNARNNASATIAKVKSELGGLDTQAQKLGGAFQAAFVGGLAGVLGVAGVTGAAVMAGSAIGDMAKRAGEVALLRNSFEQLAAGAGQSSAQMLAAMQETSGGMVSSADLMQSANKAMLLGVADTGDELAALLNVARVRGQAMGLSVTQAFNDIVTGLGRESALILDNLGITIDTTKVMDDYAASLGKAVDQLTAAERKQALLNEVMRQSAGMDTTVIENAATAWERATVAIEEAKIALGDAFGPVVTAAAQGLTITANAITNNISRQDQLSEAIRVTAQAQVAGIAYADAYGRKLGEIAASAMTSGTITKEQGELAALIYQQMSNELDMVYAASIDAGDALEITRTKLAGLAGAVDMTDPKLLALAAQLGAVGRVALAVSSDIESFNRAVAGIQSAKAIGDAAMNRAISLAAQSVQEGGSEEEALAMLRQVEIQLADTVLANDDSAAAQLRNQIAVDGVVDSLDDYVGNLREANSASKKMATEGLKDLNRAYDELEGKVSGVLQGALQTDVKIEGQDNGPYKDAINENAKRLAAIANEGLINQPWLEEFANEVPGIFADLKLTEAAGGSVRDAAAAMFAEFQLGMKPELIDRDMAKERVKQMILGEQSMAALSAEIAGELAQEMGISLGEAQAAASSALGVKPSAGATEKAGDGAAESGQANKFVSAWVLEMNTQYTRIYATGVTSGEQWGQGFLTSVQDGVPSELVMLLVTLITPGVLAKLQSMQGQSGAIP